MLDSIKGWFDKLRAGEASIDDPLVLDQQAMGTFAWDRETDVAVIGFGGAGVAAALEARDQGAEVIALERFNGGGSTKISGGIFYAGGGTTIQREAGVADDPANMYNYLAQETGDAVHQQTLREFCEHSADNLQWLMDNGVPFEASLCPFKTSYPSNLYYFYYSGNEAFPPYSDHASPAPRGHRAHGKGVSGAAFFNPLQATALKRGVSLLAQHRVTRLVTNSNGDVLGVAGMGLAADSLAAKMHRSLYATMIYLRYAAIYMPLVTWVFRALLEQVEKRYSRPITIRARSGVVISTGGFFFNRSMVAEHAPQYLPGMPLGTIGDDGSGILMGEAVDGKTALMANVSEWRFLNPPGALIKGVLVDSKGQRICNEMLYGAQLAEQISRKADGKAWLIIDGRLFKEALRGIGPSKAMWFQSATALMYLYLARKKGRSLSDLAAKLAIRPEQLAATIAQYNALCAEGRNDPLGKPDDQLAVLDKGPWYALDCRVDGLVRNPSITLGGLVVDETSGAVMANSGAVIEGLYAAGRSAVGVASHSYVSGLSLAGCIFSGRRAGHHAANRIKGDA